MPEGQTTDVDFSARYTVAGYAGIAFYAVEFATNWTDEDWTFIGSDEDDIEDESLYVYTEPEEYEDTSRLRVVMVGDDRVFEVDVEDCEVLPDEAYCHVCGQIGCTGDALDRT